MIALRPGRDCPLDYRLAPNVFADTANGVQPALSCDSLYVVGGLYGNLQALDALERLLEAEPGSQAILNGDIHWFDREPQLFAEIERRAAQHWLLRGNVETELARAENLGAGCGCAYPDSVAEQTVQWSNQIHQSLAQTLQSLPELRESLARRAACAVISVGDQRVAVSHGDELSLAGWQCSRQALEQVTRQVKLAEWMRQQNIRVFATSHTGQPAALRLATGALINNGAAGMPNFAGTGYGLISRIATNPHPAALYRSQVAGLWVEAIALHYDQDAFLSDFDRQWPASSAAAQSYRQRLLQGPNDSMNAALLGGFEPCAQALL